MVLNLLRRYYYDDDIQNGPCAFCTQPYELFGNNWKDAKTDGDFAIECIDLVALIACLVLAFQFKWVKRQRKATIRTFGYVIATLLTIIYYILVLVNTGLSEANTTTTYLYLLVYIFTVVFWRAAEVLFFAIILQTIVGSTSTGIIPKLKVVNIVAIIVLLLIAIAIIGLYIAIVAWQLTNGPYDENGDLYNLFSKYYNVVVAFQALLLVISIYATVMGVIAMIKERARVRD
ncbi:hypothetical protein G7Y89_g14091 [Cudoniella acicularis]|uniref:Chitin synthase export chaperone n=1 Tax=Cudoniella acicularis TaxID=354080 RepID=A0A8H4R898_9HELO|nr:hypothetical protein G7Y89_g14091 [Cudoniella acicularis]